jgi:hypothetical protein
MSLVDWMIENMKLVKSGILSQLLKNCFIRLPPTTANATTLFHGQARVLMSEIFMVMRN